MNRIVALLAVVLLVSGFLGGCSGKSIDEKNPDELYRDAEEDISSDHYQTALEKLRLIKNKYPYSKFAVDAQLRIADIYFMQDSYMEAATTYEVFKDLHPKHDRVPYAMFRAGKSYYMDMPGSIARDLTSAQKSLDAYNDFLKRFPAAAEAKEAREDVAALRNKLAEKELYIANFYKKWDAPGAAVARYKKIYETYPDTIHAKEAREMVEKLSKDLKK
ncbi:MAG: hypothetical protein A2583_02610 [Bdellovibrionales bacterium RIFOXYD1_FULL_53_11]|nr:MAG: hypothetical protein A2583_02610 [Bdellovibrionales bacterium RIFOXYD1_FULL_53_11]